MAKDIEQIVHKIILLFTEIYTLWATNKAFSKYHKTKKAYICEKDVFIIEDIQDFLS